MNKIAPDLAPLARPIDQLSSLANNPRKGDVEAVMRSYDTFGQRKPIVARRDGTVLAGNHQLAAARRLGWDQIAVVFVDDDDVTAKAYTLADNRIGDLGSYDSEMLAELIADVQDSDAGLLDAAGYSATDLTELLSTLEVPEAEEQVENLYTMKVDIPQYQIVGEEPAIEELFDDTRSAALQAQIADADIPDDVRSLLHLAAYRHVVFNYRKIAEFYPHADPMVQRLMEDSALVIIDYQDAIAKGYVKFSETIDELRLLDHPDSDEE